jgi:hypothetical protein
MLWSEPIIRKSYESETIFHKSSKLKTLNPKPTHTHNNSRKLYWEKTTGKITYEMGRHNKELCESSGANMGDVLGVWTPPLNL